MIKTPYRDGFRLVIPEGGKEGIYSDRRAVLCSPSLLKENGYIAVYGITDKELIHTDFMFLRLLDEYESPRLEYLFDKLVIFWEKYAFDTVYSRMRDDYGSLTSFLYSYTKNRPSLCFRLQDCTEFASVQRGWQIVREREKTHSIGVGSNSIIQRESRQIIPSMMRNRSEGLDLHERYPAYDALCTVAISYQIYPFIRPSTKKRVGNSGGYR